MFVSTQFFDLCKQLFGTNCLVKREKLHLTFDFDVDFFSLLGDTSHWVFSYSAIYYEKPFYIPTRLRDSPMTKKIFFIWYSISKVFIIIIYIGTGIYSYTIYKSKISPSKKMSTSEVIGVPKVPGFQPYYIHLSNSGVAPVHIWSEAILKHWAQAWPLPPGIW